MRTLTNSQEAVLAAGDRASVVKVEVNDGASWRDLGALGGLNWVLSVDYGETVNGRFADAVVTVKTRDHDLSLSPLATSSVINATNVLLASNNAVRINAAVMALDAVPESSDFVHVFTGEIDKVDIGLETTVVRCRGIGGDLADAYIETSETYGTEAGRNLEDVIQDILTAWGGGVTLYSITGTAGTPFQAGDSPGWAITSYPQQRQPVLDAIRILAQMIGYELRYIWNTSTSDFQLTLFEPDRAKSTPDRTFGPDRYTTLGSVSVDRSMVRNYVLVTYTAADGRRLSVNATDAASVTKYDRLWMEIAEEATNQVKASTQAQALADAALAELKDPLASHRAAIEFFPWVELGDLIRWSPDYGQIDSNLDVSVFEIRHTINASGAATTQLNCRGVPYAAMERWRGMQAQFPRREYSSRTRRTDSIAITTTTNGDFADWGEG